MADRRFHYRWEWRLPATPSALWPYVSDTDRFNRDAGVPFVEEMPGGVEGGRKLRLRKYGVRVEWDEEPFEWVKPQRFSVVRRYSSGPVLEMRVNTELEADGESGSIVRYSVDAAPRNSLGYAAIPFEIGFISQRTFHAVFRKYAKLANETQSVLPDYAKYRVDYLPRPATLAPGGDERLNGIRMQLERKFEAPLIDRFVDVIRRADDVSVVRLRPYVLADEWGIRRRDVVDLALHATREGMLDLQWDVLCPMCRGPKQSNDSLGGISQPVHCESCNIDFYANFEQSVELTFRPNRAIRSAEVFPFCVGGPQLTPHIVVQQTVKPFTTRLADVELETGRYRLRVSGIPGSQLFRVDAGGHEKSLHLVAEETGWGSSEPIASSHTQLRLTNNTDQKRQVVVERIAWSDQALTAAEVIALQEFRDLFAAEALRPGETINVGNMTILFTDLRESTRMYKQIGDASAFGRVLNHFDVLREAMAEEEGALVKTIGDAVMAVFRRPAGAIRALVRAQQMLAALPDGVPPSDLKAGVHFGPCIAVTLNERLDYFGSTVNIAARLGGLSRGGEVIISDAVAKDPEVQSLLQNIKAEEFEAKLKGLEEEAVRLFRLTNIASA
ncbi:MAG TPA: adenylate/guanylate cyclase domain-containing protein [Longimicrobiales bacterium]|nr:adenylate/guanylate cyclase domain-containing protein [Longimicrobiales bacterium]